MMKYSTKEEFEKIAQIAFKNAAYEMKAYCTDKWDHTPKDENGDFLYSACQRCDFDPFCTRFGLRSNKYAGPCDWKVTKRRGAYKK